ncbi:MAG: polysaccharide deacetylase family protein [Hydrogenophilales bacterium CG_4_9_14_3_um_filter_63_34]|nr:MAG: polysaccharide deacetylase family protein [Hydrogenophilales bacterium CG_4_10_14_3_um_filter_63_21]PJB07752.1 MAG: polysaccharide deacetylase family protein [Hydrogenophilales bacterium CG_4_9_14_3_um_filter_63_34]
MSGIINVMSVDVEDYFQVGAFEHTIARETWERWPCRVEANIERILALFARHDLRATFFTLGWIAERYPGVVRAIVAGGHELASHGHGHQRVHDLSPAAFREDVMRARKLLEDLSGMAVAGYRAPSFSIGRANLWALDVLAEAGYQYSSSIYPIAHDHYGSPEAPRFPYRPESCPALLEMPPTTVLLAGRNLPAAGGGYFRLLPYAASRWLIGRVNRLEGRPTMFYFHPWEVDPAQPRVAGAPLKSRLRHYVNLDRMEDKLDRLCNDFRWGRADQVYAAELAETGMA